MQDERTISLFLCLDYNSITSSLFGRRRCHSHTTAAAGGAGDGARLACGSAARKAGAIGNKSTADAEQARKGDAVHGA